MQTGLVKEESLGGYPREEYRFPPLFGLPGLLISLQVFGADQT